MLNLVKEGEEDYIEAIRYRHRLKIFENFLCVTGKQSVDNDFYCSHLPKIYQAFLMSATLSEVCILHKDLHVVSKLYLVC